MKGVENLLESFPVRLKASQEGDILGVVLDADTNLAGRWQSLRNHLRAAGYTNVPDAPDPAGTVCEPPQDTLLPRAGIWLMPDNRTTGMLEDFLRLLVPHAKESALFRHAETSIAAIPGTPPFIPAHRSKALMHTWLAWQEEPGKPFGTAITAKYLDPNAPQADVFIGWLERLFGGCPREKAGRSSRHLRRGCASLP
jgi:hypothetical protein